jgi:hypothetical protein
MDVSYDSARRAGLIAGVVLFLLSLVVGIGIVVHPKTAFEAEHARAEEMNPKWLSVEIATSDNRREYRENEPIFVTVRFSSAVRYQYKIEVAEGFSTSAVDVLHISNGQKIPLNRVNITCCDSRLIGLDDQPYSPRTLTPLHLPPGDYEIYLTSRRIFKWDTGPKEYRSSLFEVASNLLRIRVSKG